jgi:hypothetical protein
MRTLLWLCVGLAAGVAISFGVQRALSARGDEPEPLADVEEAGAEATSTARTRRPRPLVITDVYTSDDAAQAALAEREAMERVADMILSSAVERSESSIDTGGTVAGLFVGDPPAAVDADTPTVAAPAEAEDVDPLTAAMEDEVTRVVEGFLRDAVEGRDVQAYLSALDEDFQYTFDGGTPDDIDDDIVYAGDDYRGMVAEELFDQYPTARVQLSEPYELQLQGADVATVEYDYDMSLRGPDGSRDLRGAASFLLMRGGTRGDTDAWRIVDWVDSPPQQRER